MPKLAKMYYTTSRGEKKINCYSVAIPKEIVNKTNIVDHVKIYEKDNKIIIERA